MPIYTSLQITDIQQIITPYQIKIIDYSPIHQGNANSNYLIRTKTANYVLTVIEEKSFQEAIDLANLLRWLEKYGVATSQVKMTISGELVTQYAGKPILVKKWIDGVTNKNLSLDELFQIGSLLAQLHQIPAPIFLLKSHPYGYETFSKKVESELDVNYQNWLKMQLQFIKMHFPENLPQGLIHGDLFFDNVLFNNGKVKAIIDFEDACYYSLIFDLGMAVVGLCEINKKLI